MRPSVRTCLALAFIAGSHAVSAADPERGAGLYENHCTGCHDSVAHERAGRKADSAASLQRWVERWSRHLELGWSAEDREDVAAYLDGRFYRFGSGTR